MNRDMFYYDGNVISLVTFFYQMGMPESQCQYIPLKVIKQEKKILHVFHIQFVIIVIF